VGVDIFFVISGFVITASLAREWERTGTLNLPAFYVRRVKRLLPGLATVLGFVAVAGVLLTPVAATHMTAVTGVAAGIFGANMYLGSLPNGYFDASSSLDPLLHTWSLAVEEQFYLAFPLLLLVVWRKRLRIRPVVAIAAVLVVSFALALAWQHLDPPLAFYGSPARAWEFAAGALAALLIPVWRRLPSLICSALALTGIIAIFAAVAFGPVGSSLTLRLGLPVAGTCLLMIAGHCRNPISGILSLGPLSWVGDLSYSWYLWHWPMIVFAAALWPLAGFATWIAAVASLVPAWLAYRFIENPIRFKWSPTPRRVLVLAAACIAVPVGLSIATLEVRLPTAYGAKVATADHIDRRRGCDGTAPLGLKPSACTWPIQHARGTVVLIGDSNAGHFSEPVIAADRALRLNTFVATQGACDFSDHFTLSDSGCVKFDRGSLNWLRQHPPNLVIIGARTDLYITGRFVIPGISPQVDQVDRARVYERRLHSTLLELSRSRIPVLVVHPIPYMPAANPGACASLLLYLNHGCGRTSMTSRKSVDAWLSLALAAEQKAIASVPRTSLLNLEDEICNTTTCSTNHNGVPMYRDQYHLSIPGALSLTPILRRAIETHIRRP
jgi:peptidoglycan/LPS O-acetylase OafA/YrhL